MEDGSRLERPRGEDTRASVVLAWRRFGPYHEARARAARRLLPLLTVELSQTDDVYAWERIRSPNADQMTLVDGNPDALSNRVLESKLHCFLDATAPAAVAVPGWGEPWARSMLRWCALRGVACVVMSDSNQHDAARSTAVEWFKAQLVSRFDAGLTAGTAGKAYLTQLGLPASRVFEGYDVVDNVHFSAPTPEALNTVRAQTPTRPFFLASARFVEKKNLGRLIEAYAAYRQNCEQGSWDLVLIGDGHLRTELEARSATLGVDAFVHMPGFKQYDELPAWYASAGAFVHVSTTEQWGLVVNEAMAAGLPVIVSDRCGCAVDLVADGDNGLTADPFDTAAISRAMVHVAHGDVDRARMGARSRAIIAGWGPERFADGLRRAVAAAMAAPRRRVSPAGRALLWALARR